MLKSLRNYLKEEAMKEVLLEDRKLQEK